MVIIQSVRECLSQRERQHGRKVYLFYRNSNPPSGVRTCITSARTRLRGPGYALEPFYVYEGDNRFSPTTKALPEGFTLAAMAQFYSEFGGAGQCLFRNNLGPGDQYSGLTFKVAKVRGRRLWLAVEERVRFGPTGASSNQVVLRISKHPAARWAEASEYVLEEEPGGWGSVKLTDPLLVDSLGTTNEVVTPEDFWIIGNNRAGTFGSPTQLRAVRLRLTFR